MRRWPQLDRLCQLVRTQPGVELWLFGSALTSLTPADLDVLLLYEDLVDIEAIRSAHPWEDESPPIHIIAMPSVAKTVAAMRANPRNVRYEDLAKICEHYFGPPRSSAGSHAVFTTPWPG